MAFAKSDKENYFFQNTLLEKYLIPAVKQTGYDLSNPLASDPKAGNIHARMEVEIRASRFIIAELSHHNNGAYWEAGFAKGLGKPVIYMFNKKIAKDEKPPHFDVGSDHIVFWDESEPDKAAQALKGVSFLPRLIWRPNTVNANGRNMRFGKNITLSNERLFGLAHTQAEAGHVRVKVNHCAVLYERDFINSRFG
jgi:hypothetical protein